MNKVLSVLLKELGFSLRRKSFLLFAFGIPLILGVVALAFFLVNRQPAAAAPEDEAPTISETAATSRQGFVDPGRVIDDAGLPADGFTAYTGEATAQAALEAGEIDGYFLIPANYVASGEVTYVTREYNPLTSGVDRGALEWALLVSILGGDAARAQRVRQPLDLEVTALAPPQQEEDNWLAELFPTLVVLAMYLVILIPAGVLVNSLTDEKKNRVLEVLLTSVRPSQMFLGKFLALGLLGLLQAACWFGVFFAVLRFGGQSLAIPPDFEIPRGLLFWALVYTLTGYAMYGVQMAGIGAIAPDFKETRTTNLVVMMPIIAAYIFVSLIIVRPNSALAILFSFFPLTSPIAMIARMTATTVPAWQPALAAVLQIATAVLLFLLVVRLFRAKYLLSGQPISPQRYLALLFSRT